jgi:hypothetical protein
LVDLIKKKAEAPIVSRKEPLPGGETIKGFVVKTLTFFGSTSLAEFPVILEISYNLLLRSWQLEHNRIPALDDVRPAPLRTGAASTLRLLL